MRLRPQTLLAAALAAASIWPTWPPLFRIWSESTDYEHGPLVALIVVVWLFLASSKIPDAPPHVRGDATWRPTVLLVLAMGVWVMASQANVEIGKQALAPIIIWLAIATAAGWRAALALAAPVLYLYFAIPVWEQIVPVLQWMTVFVSHTVLAIAGVPVRIDGVLVTIPEGSFIVMEGCSGKRYLIVALGTAALIAAASSMGWRRTGLYLSVTAAIAIFANWVRVIIVIVAGHVTDMTSYLVAREHFSLGWVIFAALLIAVWAAGQKLGREQPESRAPGAITAVAPANLKRLLLTAGVLCVPTLVMLLTADSQPSGTDASIAVPHAGPKWRDATPPSQQWQPSYPGAARHHLAAFESESGMQIETYWAAYGAQTRDAKLVYYANTLTGKGWLTLSRSSSQRAVGGHSATMRTLLVQAPGGERWLIDYYYVVDGIQVSREWAAQALYGVLSWGRPPSSGVVAAAAPCKPSCAGAEQTLSMFWAASGS